MLVIRFHFQRFELDLKVLGSVLIYYSNQNFTKGPSIKDVKIFQGGGFSQIPMLQDIRR
jgi:hypothetical protein